MSTRLPPRREPRVMSLIRSPTGFHLAIVDPWEVRVARSVCCRDLSLGPAIVRAIRREKPTLVVTRDTSLRGAMERAARRVGIGSMGASLPMLPLVIARDLYPELPLKAPTPPLANAAAHAIAAVLYAAAPQRRYAPRRHRPLKHAA